ncbi:hypothetical protein C8R42DRAFT_336043 [Lentinula raphanica]|nr:hypothetical protein C8R42DRAFT_336043 [Lentinula raphanica]
MEESTPLSCSLADQGIKIRIRKDIRVRKRPNTALLDPQPMSNRGNNVNVSAGQHNVGAQAPLIGTPGVSTSHFNGSSTSSSGFSDSMHNTHPHSQQQQHTYASFPLPQAYQQQFHPLAPPPGSMPASGPLQPLPPEAQPAWANVGSIGPDTVNLSDSQRGSGADGRRSQSPTSPIGTTSVAGDEDDRRTDPSGSSDSITTGDISKGPELGMGMDIDETLRIHEDDTQSDNDTDRAEGRPHSSSGRLTRSGRGSGSTREHTARDKDREDRRQGRDSPKPRPKAGSLSLNSNTSSSTRREQKRARTDSYQQPQYQQPIAPAPWAPAPHPPLTATSSTSTSTSSAGSNSSVVGGSGVPAPVLDSSLNGASIGGLPPGIRIPPPPGAIIAPRAPNSATETSRSGTVTPTDTEPPNAIVSLSRIPPPPGATIESSPVTTSPSSTNSTNAGGASGITTAMVDASISEASVHDPTSPTGGPITTSVYQHQSVPFEQSHAHQAAMSGPPAYSLHTQPPQMPALPPPHPGNPTQYPPHVPHSSQQQTQHHPLPLPPPPLPHSHSHPGPTPYGAFRQPHMPTHPQYGYSAPPHASYNAGHPPPTMAPPTPQGYAGYPAWGVNSNQQLIPQEQYQQPMAMQMQYQQPGYVYPPPPPAQVRPYEYGQSLQPQPQTQPMYTSYAPAPYGYYDPAQQQPGGPPQQLQQSAFQASAYGGTVGTPSPGAIGAAPVVGAPPLLGPGQPGQPGQQSTTPPNGNGYPDYGPSSYASQPPPGPPRPGSPRAFQPPQSQQYGYPGHQIPPPPPHHPQYAQHSQHPPGPPAPYPPPYGYMTYASNGNGTGGNGSLPNTPGVVGLTGNNGSVGQDMWGAGSTPSAGAPVSWDSTMPSVYTAPTPAPAAPYPQQSHAGLQLNTSGDRIQLAPMRQSSSGSDSGMYPSIIQLRSSSRSSKDDGKQRSGSGVANISTTGRERDRDRGRDRERDVGQIGRERERDDRMRHLDRDKERVGDSRNRDRDERGTKKNPLAIGNIIESGP